MTNATSSLPPIWRQASPGLIGLLLHLAGLLGARARDTESIIRGPSKSLPSGRPSACVWHTICPVCDGDAFIGTTEPDDPFAMGQFQCNGYCAATQKAMLAADTQDDSADEGDDEPEAGPERPGRWESEVLDALGHRAGAPSDIDRSVGLFTLCEIYLEAAHKIELSIGCRVISRRAYE